MAFLLLVSTHSKLADADQLADGVLKSRRQLWANDARTGGAQSDGHLIKCRMKSGGTFTDLSAAHSPNGGARSGSGCRLGRHTSDLSDHLSLSASSSHRKSPKPQSWRNLAAQTDRYSPIVSSSAVPRAPPPSKTTSCKRFVSWATRSDGNWINRIGGRGDKWPKQFSCSSLLGRICAESGPAPGGKSRGGRRRRGRFFAQLTRLIGRKRRL